MYVCRNKESCRAGKDTVVFLLVILGYIIIRLNACSAGNFQVVYPEYSNLRKFDATLLVMPLNAIIVDSMNPGKSARSAGASARQFTWSELNYFNNYMGSAISEITTARVMGIDPYFRPENVTFRRRTLTAVDKYHLDMICPQSGIIRFYGITPDYVLFFEDLYFKKDYQESMDNIGNGTDKTFSISTGLEYLIWDNHYQQIAGYGKFTKYISLLKYPTKETYIQLFEDYADMIISHSPLVKKY